MIDFAGLWNLKLFCSSPLQWLFKAYRSLMNAVVRLSTRRQPMADANSGATKVTNGFKLVMAARKGGEATISRWQTACKNQQPGYRNGASGK